MAIFIVDVTKRYVDTLEKYGNRWLIQAIDMTEAISAAPLIVAQEKAFHSYKVEFLQARVATLAANDGVYVTVPLSEVGDLIGTGPVLPAITTVNVAFVVSGFGRPSRKYFHPMVDAAYMGSAAQHWTDLYVSDVLGKMETLLDDLSTNATPAVDPDGQELKVPVVSKLFGFHQFTKRSKRPLL